MVGSVLIKNISEETYSVEELGGAEIPAGESLDLMDEALPNYYNNWWAANYLVTVENPSQLWSDIQAGKIELMSSTEPERLEIPEIDR